MRSGKRGHKTEAEQRLLDIAAQADAREGIRQGLEHAEEGKTRLVREFLAEFEARHIAPRDCRDSHQDYETLRRNVRAGFAAVDRGEFTDYDQSTVQELAKRVKARGAKKLANTGNRSTPRPTR